MDRIFHHDDTIYEAATKVYAKTDGYAYFEADYKTKVPADVLEDLFVRGLIIVDAGIMYKPVSLKTNSSTSTTADLATVKSA